MSSLNEMATGQKKQESSNNENRRSAGVQAACVAKNVDVELEKMHNKLETGSMDDVDSGNGNTRTSSKEFKINIETTTDSTDAPVLSLSNISEDVASSFKKDETRSVEFSEEKDAPEMSSRVYDFDMVKEKTLPRRVQLGGRGLMQFCSSQPKTHLLTWSLMATSILICTLIFLLYWLIW